MLLEVATAAGGLLGGVTAQMLAPATLRLMFSGVAVVVGDRDAGAAPPLERHRRRPMRIRARSAAGIYDERLGRTVTYRFKRMPLALVASFVAGNVSSLLGLGGGVHQGAGAQRVVRRPDARGGRDERLHDWRHRHRRRGDLLRPRRARARACRGGRGRRAERLLLGMRLAARLHGRWLRLLLAAVLFWVAGMMYVGAR